MIDIEIQISISERSSGWAINYSVSGSPVGVEEGDRGGDRVEGDEGGCQGASQAPGQKALPWDHLQNQTELSVGGGKQALLCNHCMRMPHSKYLRPKTLK